MINLSHMTHGDLWRYYVVAIETYSLNQTASNKREMDRAEEEVIGRILGVREVTKGPVMVRA